MAAWPASVASAGQTDLGIGHKREDRVGIETRAELQDHGRRRVETERKRPTRGDDQPRRDRRTERHKFSKPLRVESLDRQSEERLTAVGDQHRPSGVKFGDPATNVDLQLRAEQTGNGIPLYRAHQMQLPTNIADRPLAGGLNIEHRDAYAHSVRNVICFVSTFCRRYCSNEGIVCL